MTAQTSWQAEVLFLLNQIYDEMHSEKRSLLRLLSQAVSLCACIEEHIQHISGHNDAEESWMIIRKMTGYIHQHYDLKMTMDDIAAAGTVCRSK